MGFLEQQRPEYSGRFSFYTIISVGCLNYYFFARRFLNFVTRETGKSPVHPASIDKDNNHPVSKSSRCGTIINYLKFALVIPKKGKAG